MKCINMLKKNLNLNNSNNTDIRRAAEACDLKKRNKLAKGKKISKRPDEILLMIINK